MQIIFTSAGTQTSSFSLVKLASIIFFYAKQCPSFNHLSWARLSINTQQFQPSGLKQAILKDKLLSTTNKLKQSYCTFEVWFPATWTCYSQYSLAPTLAPTVPDLWTHYFRNPVMETFTWTQRWTDLAARCRSSTWLWPYVHPILVNVTSLARSEGISSNMAQIATSTQEWAG